MLKIFYTTNIIHNSVFYVCMQRKKKHSIILLININSYVRAEYPNPHKKSKQYIVAPVIQPTILFYF